MRRLQTLRAWSRRGGEAMSDIKLMSEEDIRRMVAGYPPPHVPPKVKRKFWDPPTQRTFWQYVPAGQPPLEGQGLAPRMPPVPSGTFVRKESQP